MLKIYFAWQMTTNSCFINIFWRIINRLTLLSNLKHSYYYYINVKWKLSPTAFQSTVQFVMKDFDYFKRYDGKPKSLKICDNDSINYEEINKYSVQQACFCIMCYVFCTSWNKVLTCGQLIWYEWRWRARNCLKTLKTRVFEVLWQAILLGENVAYNCAA